ncbi:unnamed protein product [Phaeothamnion confervicola]
MPYTLGLELAARGSHYEAAEYFAVACRLRPGEPSFWLRRWENAVAAVAAVAAAPFGAAATTASAKRVLDALPFANMQPDPAAVLCNSGASATVVEPQRAWLEECARLCAGDATAHASVDGSSGNGDGAGAGRSEAADTCRDCHACLIEAHMAAGDDFLADAACQHILALHDRYDEEALLALSQILEARGDWKGAAAALVTLHDGGGAETSAGLGFGGGGRGMAVAMAASAAG